jgi:hypothetical protein
MPRLPLGKARVGGGTVGEYFAGRASWFVPSGHFVATHAGVDAPTVASPESGESLGIERCSLPKSILPEMFEPLGSQLGVPHGVLNIAMAQVGLQRACVVPLGGQCEPAGMP